jgi:5-methylcytosine-specific restriction enzyme A
MPEAPAVACRCGKLNCQEHSAKAKAKQHDEWRGTAASRGYGYNWTSRLRPMILRRDPLCRDPFRIGCTQPSKIGDHIIPKSAGGMDALENTQGLCIDCHNRKIALERATKFVSACPCRIKTMAAIGEGGCTLVLGCDAHQPNDAFPVGEWTSRLRAL